MGSRRPGAISKPQNAEAVHVQDASTLPKEDHKIDMSTFDMICLPPPPLPPRAPSSPPPPPPPPLPPPIEEKLVLQPMSSTQVSTTRPSSKTPRPVTSVKFFTIATLQQYTNSFSQENLIGEGMLGTVYRAQLPDGKVYFRCKLNVISFLLSARIVLRIRRHYIVMFFNDFFIFFPCIFRSFSVELK